MLSIAKQTLRLAGIDSGRAYRRLSAASIRAAAAEQGLADTIVKLRAVVPDLSDQFTDIGDAVQFAEYGEIKMRAVHAFQLRCVLDTLPRLGDGPATVVDIGDSSGNHAAYIRALAPGIVRVASVNLDSTAVAKIKAKGGEAYLCRAEDVQSLGIAADLYLSFQTLEHLIDPIRFLHDLAIAGTADYFLITVPYRRESRFGGYFVRNAANIPGRISPERAHIFELSPDDWSSLALFAGWRTEYARIYRQYPIRHPLIATMPLWRAVDFEGFLALLLRRDRSVADRYDGWPGDSANTGPRGE